MKTGRWVGARRSVLSVAVAAGMAWFDPVEAQAVEPGETAERKAAKAASTGAAPKRSEVVDLEGVQVVGIRASLQRALDNKRNADAIVDGITAEDVGKFPATNVAEAMTIIPGVTIDKLFGQGEKVSILGTDPALNRTLLNGQTVASADWFITDQPGRTFNYSLLAPQIVGRVNVYKSPEAHIDEGSIGGTVMVSTRKPLELERDLMVAGQFSAMRNDRIEKNDPQTSVLLGWKNPAKTFGVIVSAQRAKENIRRDGVESYGTVRAKDYIDGKGGGGSVNNPPMDWSIGAPKALTCTGICADTLLANPDARGPNAISAHFFEQERKRDTYTVALQFKPLEQLNVEFNSLDVKARYDNISHSMFAFPGNPYNGLMKMTDATIDRGVITGGSFSNALVVYDLINRRATVDTYARDLKLDWEDERWFASAQLGTTKATGGTGRQVFGEFLNWSDYRYDISGAPDRPGAVYFANGNPFTDPSAFRPDGGWGSDPGSASTWNPGWGGNIVSKPTYDKERYAQLDVGLKLDSPVYQLRFGIKRREHQTGQSMSGVALASVAGYGDASAAEFNPRPLPGNYLDGFSGVGDLSRRFTIDGWKLADYILAGKWLAPWQTMPVPNTFNDPSFVANTWTVSEDVNAAYVQADFAWQSLRGNVGVRYARTSSNSDSWVCSANVSPCPATAYVPSRVGRKYGTALPNVNLTYDLRDDLILRFSAAKVMARPNFGDMSSYLWLGDQTLTGGGGNPHLNPYRSTNVDVSAEWYFSPDAILAGTLFYKDVSDYILVTTSPEVHFNQSRQANTTYQISRPKNAGSASIKGASVAYQQNLGGGFGLVANYTYADGASDAGSPMPYNSRSQLNLSPFYERGRWTTRLSYAWRSKYFTNVDRGDELWTRDYTSLDATVSYRINEQLSLQLDGMNLLDEVYQSYADDPRLTRGAYRSGRRYMVSVRAQF